MDDTTIPFKGTSMSISFFLFDNYIELENVVRILKKFNFNNERKFGFKEIKEFKDHIEIKYMELMAKNVEIFENNKVVLKTIYQPKNSFIILFEDSSILIGATNFVRKIMNKLKNIINLEFRPVLKNKTQMMKLYKKFFKVYQLNLIEEDEFVYVKSLKIKGDLTDLENWKDFSSINRFLSEIYGQFEINELIFNLRVYSNCSCQIYKNNDFILKESIIWLKNFLFEL